MKRAITRFLAIIRDALLPKFVLGELRVRVTEKITKEI